MDSWRFLQSKHASKMCSYLEAGTSHNALSTPRINYPYLKAHFALAQTLQLQAQPFELHSERITLTLHLLSPSSRVGQAATSLYVCRADRRALNMDNRVGKIASCSVAWDVVPAFFTPRRLRILQASYE